MSPVLPILQSNELKVNETITKDTLLSSVRSNNKNKKIKVHLDLFTHPPEEIQSIPNKSMRKCSNKFALEQKQVLDVFKKTFLELERKLTHNFYFCSEKKLKGHILEVHC